VFSVRSVPRCFKRYISLGIIRFAKPVLTEDMHIVQKEEFSITCYMSIRTLDQGPSPFIRGYYIRITAAMVQLQKKNTDLKTQGA
jgi:hypothetical protein